MPAAVAVDVQALGTRPSHVARLEPRLGDALAVGGPLLLGLLVALPVVLLLVNSFNVAQPGRDAVYGLQNWIRAFSDPVALSALWNTFALGSVRTAISLPLAIGLTWLIARSDLPGRSVLELLCWLGVFLPQLPMTLGWIL